MRASFMPMELVTSSARPVSFAHSARNAPAFSAGNGTVANGGAARAVAAGAVTIAIRMDRLSAIAGGGSALLLHHRTFGLGHGLEQAREHVVGLDALGLAL